MVSWFYQMQATNTLPAGITIVGGLMMSGGSYQCYNDPKDPDMPVTPVTTCKGCMEGGPSHCYSTQDPHCDSCNPAVVPYCQQCCPKNYTEDFYLQNPTKWTAHPPTFLGQTSLQDDHADLCATRNYYQTLKANGVRAALMVVPKADLRCSCIGTPGNAAAAGSPYSSHCDSSWKTCASLEDQNCCISHTLGFADMVVPATQFVLDSFK
eukprot:UC1_evm1s637